MAPAPALRARDSWRTERALQPHLPPPAALAGPVPSGCASGQLVDLDGPLLTPSAGWVTSGANDRARKAAGGRRGDIVIVSGERRSCRVRLSSSATRFAETARVSTWPASARSIRSRTVGVLTPHRVWPPVADCLRASMPDGLKGLLKPEALDQCSKAAPPRRCGGLDGAAPGRNRPRCWITCPAHTLIA